LRELALVVLCSFLLAPLAHAGPIDAALGGLIGADPSWWLEAVALVSALLGLVSALVKDSALPAWARTALNLAASNWGHAKNAPE